MQDLSEPPIRQERLDERRQSLPGIVWRMSGGLLFPIYGSLSPFEAVTGHLGERDSVPSDKKCEFRLVVCDFVRVGFVRRSVPSPSRYQLLSRPSVQTASAVARGDPNSSTTRRYLSPHRVGNPTRVAHFVGGRRAGCACREEEAPGAQLPGVIFDHDAER